LYLSRTEIDDLLKDCHNKGITNHIFADYQTRLIELDGDKTEQKEE